MTHRRLALCTVVAGISCSDRVSFRVFGDNEIQNVSKHNECDRYNDVSQRLHWMGRKKRCLEHNVSKMMPTTPPGPSTGNNDTQTYLSGTNIKARNSDSPAVVDNKKVQKCQFVGSLISGKCIAMGDSQIHTSHERGGYISHKSTTSASITNSIDTENKNEEKDSVQAGMKANSNNRRKLKASRDSKTGRNPNINNDNISYSINDIDSKSNNNIRDHSTPTLSPSPSPSPPLPRTELADFSGSLPEYLNNLLSLSGGNLEEIHEFANKLDKVTMTQIQNVQNIQVPSLQDYLSETVQDSIASGKL